MPAYEKRRRGRPTLSCTECKRRKQKCDKQWPCGHCQGRRMGHRCEFEAAPYSQTKKQQIPKAAGAGPSSEGRNPPDPPASCAAEGIQEAFIALKALGYVENNPLRASQIGRQPVSSHLQISEKIREALRTVPPRPYADLLVKSFFDHLNYHYGVVHEESFLESYLEWWSCRQHSERTESSTTSSIAFTCLMLQICASAAQSLPTWLQDKIEVELGDEASEMSLRYREAAETLCDFIPPGEAGVTKVQQMVLDTAWLKTEASLVKAWHVLAKAAREAQEIGMHLDDPIQGISSLERDMRRRLWYTIVTWDNYATTVLGRPPILLEHSSGTPPNPRMDLLGTSDDIPSSTAVLLLEHGLSVKLRELFTAGDDDTRVSFIKEWMASLPLIFRPDTPDTTENRKYHPRLVFQRLRLHALGYMTALTYLQKYLNPFDTSHPSTYHPTQPELEKLGHAIDFALKLIATVNDAFEYCTAERAKYFVVSFSPFHVASLLSSALLRDSNRKLPRRLEIIGAVGQALHILHRLRRLTKLGDTACSVLSRLVNLLCLSDDERDALERAKSHEPVVSYSKGSPAHCTDEDINIGLPEAMPTAGAEWDGDSLALDLPFYVSDPIWEWEAIGIEPVGFYQ
ncbi:hypothetical protein GQ53DRAFT_703200 [Thozetella sp. PMI_491]|nr:hypothetical protein GQ53DRAFT_703200 [Thozetella sp. PMI_491]